jgi:hypothetical protein
LYAISIQLMEGSDFVSVLDKLEASNEEKLIAEADAEINELVEYSRPMVVSTRPELAVRIPWGRGARFAPKESDPNDRPSR